MKRTLIAVFVLSVVTSLSRAAETSFRHVKMPNQKGKEIKAVLTFSDNDKAVEVRPAKGQRVAVPYSQIDKCTYEYTEGFMSKVRWLKIDYHDPDAHRFLLLRLTKHDYIHVLDALKAHTGIDAELLGNANKGGHR